MLATGCSNAPGGMQATPPTLRSIHARGPRQTLQSTSVGFMPAYRLPRRRKGVSVQGQAGAEDNPG
eukprot:9846330-Alexandrium_andersonii.AAC.1